MRLWEYSQPVQFSSSSQPVQYEPDSSSRQFSSRQLTTSSPQLRTRIQVTGLRVISCRVNNCSLVKERPNKQRFKQAIYELLVTSPRQHVTIQLYRVQTDQKISTIALRVVEGEEKVFRCLGV
jgi:hypothetical protein